jgi:hypothetical protein
MAAHAQPVMDREARTAAAAGKVRTMRQLIAAAALILSAVTAVLALPADAATHTPAVKSWSYVGPIHPRDNPHWCLTAAETTDQDGSPVFLLPCVNKFINQQWFAGHIGFPRVGIGEIGYVGNPALRFGRRSPWWTAILIDENKIKPRRDILVLNFSNQGGDLWRIWWGSGKNEYFLSVPSHVKRGQQIQPRWQKLGAKNMDQLWAIPFKENS